MEKLTGTVELDKESLDKIKSEMRKELIKEIIESKSYKNDELEDILLDMSVGSYLNLFQITVNSHLRKLLEKSTSSPRELQDRRILEAIRALLEI